MLLFLLEMPRVFEKGKKNAHGAGIFRFDSTGLKGGEYRLKFYVTGVLMAERKIILKENVYGFYTTERCSIIQGRRKLL